MNRTTKWVSASLCALSYFVTDAAAVEIFADQVVSYTAGSGATLTNPASALGKPAAATGFKNFSPFNPHFASGQIVQVGSGGELTLRLQNYVLVDTTSGVPEIGIWENVGLADNDFPNGTASNPATVFGADSAVVSVSADNVNWIPLNGGAPILFTLPGNYYANGGPFDDNSPANPVLADFGKPFTGTLSDFDGKTYAQVLAELGGSAGGTWLDLDSTGLSQVGYIRFSGVAAGETLEVDAVAINGSHAGATVPEPSTGMVLAGLALGLALRRYRGNHRAS